MAKVSFDFSGRVSGADVHVAYEVGTGRNIIVKDWTDQQLADALNGGIITISLGDHLHGPGFENNVINQTNYQPG